MLSEDDHLIPIRAVESLTYCPRQAWYRFVACDDPLNIHMERGLRRHDTMDETAPRPPVASVMYRHVPVTAPKLGVTGVIDEVEIGPELLITEYKAARLAAFVWPGVLMQLAVQHLALREQVSTGWDGPPLPNATTLRVYFTDSRRYRAVQWSEQLAREAVAAVEQCREVFSLQLSPPGFVGPRCRNCQHEPICMPDDLPILAQLGHKLRVGESE